MIDVPSPLSMAFAAALAAAGTGCMQDLTVVGTGTDGGFVLPTCDESKGPAINCDPVDPKLRRPGEVVTISCQISGSGAVELDGPITAMAGLGTDRSLSGSRAQYFVQLRSGSVPPGLADSQVDVAVGAHLSGQPTACRWITVQVGLIGNLWAADEQKGSIVAIDSAGVVVTQDLKLPGMPHPRLLSKVHDGVLVGGRDDGGSNVLAVYAFSGEKVRDLAGVPATLASAHLHSAAERTDGALFITTGTGATDGTLWLYNGASFQQITLSLGRSPRGVAAVGQDVVVTLSDGTGTLARVGSSTPTGSAVNPSYRDSNGASCSLSGTFGIATLDNGNVWVSGTDSLASLTYGAEYLFTTSFLASGRTQHAHPTDAGRLFLSRGHDWLAEARPHEVLVAASKDSTQIDVVDSSTLGTSGGWGSFAGFNPRGLLRLR